MEKVPQRVEVKGSFSSQSLEHGNTKQKTGNITVTYDHYIHCWVLKLFGPCIRETTVKVRHVFTEYYAE